MASSTSAGGFCLNSKKGFRVSHAPSWSYDWSSLPPRQICTVSRDPIHLPVDLNSESLYCIPSLSGQTETWRWHWHWSQYAAPSSECAGLVCRPSCRSSILQHTLLEGQDTAPKSSATSWRWSSKSILWMLTSAIGRSMGPQAELQTIQKEN